MESTEVCSPIYRTLFLSLLITLGNALLTQKKYTDAYFVKCLGFNGRTVQRIKKYFKAKGFIDFSGGHNGTTFTLNEKAIEDYYGGQFFNNTEEPKENKETEPMEKDHKEETKITEPVSDELTPKMPGYKITERDGKLKLYFDTYPTKEEQHSMRHIFDHWPEKSRKEKITILHQAACDLIMKRDMEMSQVFSF